MLLVILLFITSICYTQDISDSDINHQSKISYLSFRHHDTDKYYIGWMNPRAFISRVYINHNFDLEKALLSRNISSKKAWNFSTITALIEGRIATEFYLFRHPLVAIGIGAAFEVPLLTRTKLQLTKSKQNILNIYSLIGQAAVFVDVYLPYDMKLRIMPFYHESVHIADGYVGNPKDFSFISYEFLALELYSKIQLFTFYTGVEVTYHASAQTERLLRTRLQFGLDVRYPIWKNIINLIAGINIAALYDENNIRFPKTNGWHPALNMAIGIEFDRVILALKYAHQRGFESVTYQVMQDHLGMECTVLF